MLPTVRKGSHTPLSLSTKYSSLSSITWLLCNSPSLSIIWLTMASQTNELQGSSFTCLTVEVCARNWQSKVDETTSPFHLPEPINKIPTGQVNLPFIRPHSGALLRRFARNHFSLRSMPQFDAWIAVYISRPPSTFICHAFPHSGLICNHWSTSPLIFNHQIKRHIIIFSWGLWT